MTPERNRTGKPRNEEELPPEELLLLSRISNEMVQAQKRYYGRGPTQAKSYILDDFVLVVMRGGMTVAEQTMLDFNRGDLVRSFRQELEAIVSDRLVETVQALTGRSIGNHQTQIYFDPHIVVEMFFFEAGDTTEAPVDEAEPTG